jgi:surface antigen
MTIGLCSSVSSAETVAPIVDHQLTSNQHDISASVVSRSFTRPDDQSSWSIGSSNNVHIDYSPTPSERVAALMSEQTKNDAARLQSEGENHLQVGVQPSLAKDTMSQLEDQYTRIMNAPSNHVTGDNGNAYEFSQCTWWAYVRRHQLGLPAGSHMGNGQDWASTAMRLGYRVDHNPRIGDVMVFRSGQLGASSAYGHVAIVENVITVHDQEYVVTSEMGSSLQGVPASRIIGSVHDFLYVHD